MSFTFQCTLSIFDNETFFLLILWCMHDGGDSTQTYDGVMSVDRLSFSVQILEHGFKVRDISWYFVAMKKETSRIVLEFLKTDQKSYKKIRLTAR